MPRVAWKSFTEARALVRGLGLKGNPGWREWSKSRHRPSDIPSNPEKVYCDAGWVSWPDWLGNGKERVAWKSFTVGRALARGLGLTGQSGWQEWKKSGQRPSDIPSLPDSVYRNDGWISWPDWLGFEGRAPPGSMLPFAVGRAYARKLKLGSWKKWAEWSKSGQRPSNIPSHPEQTYRDDGWISWPDWLGNGKERTLAKDMLPFTEGRAYVRGLELKGKTGWKEWSKSGCRPSDIPGCPDQTYRNDGWVSWPDWLGNGNISNQARHVNMLPFTVGRAYVRKLKLRNNKEWCEWSKSGQRPTNIPGNPNKVYRNDGWISMPDWLGYGSSAGGAAASRSSSSNSSATTAPKKKTKKKRKRRPATSHPSDLPPPPPPATSPVKPDIKTEPPSSKSSGGSSDRSTEPPLRKIKKEEDA
jgi:hypothetical protein